MSGQVHYDLIEGDRVTLPDGEKVKVESLGHDHLGDFFTCVENGENVFYYTDILDTHPDNAPLRYGTHEVTA